MSFQVRACSSVDTSTGNNPKWPTPIPSPYEYLSFQNPDPYLLAIILNSTVSISILLANPCAMPCIYKPRNLFQLSSASTSETVFVVLFWFPLKSFYTCYAVFVLWCRENLFHWWRKVIFVVYWNMWIQIRWCPNCQWIQGQMNQTGALFHKKI